MPGPKSPYGYDETFHKLLAEIQAQRPEQIIVETVYTPTRMRALFNQFRSAWEKESEKFRKRKDLENANRALENYYALLRYSCTTFEHGIILTNKTISNDTITSVGRVLGPITSPLPSAKDLEELGIDTPSGGSTWKDINRKQEEDIYKIMGTKPKQKQEQIIPDNPPPIDTSNKYGLPIGPPPGFPDVK